MHIFVYARARTQGWRRWLRKYWKWQIHIVSHGEVSRSSVASRPVQPVGRKKTLAHACLESYVAEEHFVCFYPPVDPTRLDLQPVHCRATWTDWRLTDTPAGNSNCPFCLTSTLFGLWEEVRVPRVTPQKLGGRKARDTEQQCKPAPHCMAPPTTHY